MRVFALGGQIYLPQRHKSTAFEFSFKIMFLVSFDEGFSEHYFDFVSAQTIDFHFSVSVPSLATIDTGYMSSGST